MIVFIQLFGLFTAFTGLIILVNPEIVFALLRKNTDKLQLHIIAVVIRLALGICLIYQAGNSKYPLTMEVLGWISIVAALFLTVIGRTRFKALMMWALSHVKTIGRIGGVFVSIFGAFIVYAFM